MREIKFRAFFSNTSHMVDWAQLKREFGMCELDGLAPGLIFMQYTGLKDKNSKEIYEGDILGALSSNGIMHKEEVIFENSMFTLKRDMASLNLAEFVRIVGNNTYEIIGNIYEHSNSSNTSGCCHAPVRVEGGDKEDSDEGKTRYFVCTKCDKPCNTFEVEHGE